MATTKGYDDSPPRNGIIFFYTVLTVFLLVGVKLLLDSYFAKMMDAEIHDKVLTRGMEEVQAMRADESKKLEQANIAGAMKSLAQRGRTQMPQIAPESGYGKEQIAGWSQMKRTVEPVVLPKAEAVPEAAPSTSTPVAPAPVAPSPRAPRPRPAAPGTTP